MVVLAFDQSYKNIGYSIYNGKDVLDSGSFKLANYPNSVARRSFIKALAKALDLCYSPDTIVAEQIRLKSKFGVNINTIICLAEITSTIADAIYPKKIYTIDSRSWKAKVIKNGSANKSHSVLLVKSVFDLDVDHDCADAICMSMYPFENKPILNLYE